jgi:hypothetical protein
MITRVILLRPGSGAAIRDFVYCSYVHVPNHPCFAQKQINHPQLHYGFGAPSGPRHEPRDTWGMNSFGGC